MRIEECVTNVAFKRSARDAKRRLKSKSAFL